MCNLVLTSEAYRAVESCRRLSSSARFFNVRVFKFRAAWRHNWRVKLTYDRRIEEWNSFYNYYFGHYKEKKPTTTYGSMFIWKIMFSYGITECMSYCSHTRLCVATDLSQLSHTVEIVLFAGWQGVFHRCCPKYRQRVNYGVLVWKTTYFCNLQCESPSICFNFTYERGRVLLSYLMGVDRLDFEEITTGLSFKFMNLFEFLPVKQLSAT